MEILLVFLLADWILGGPVTGSLIGAARGASREARADFVRRQGDLTAARRKKLGKTAQGRKQLRREDARAAVWTGVRRGLLAGLKEGARAYPARVRKAGGYVRGKLRKPDWDDDEPDTDDGPPAERCPWMVTAGERCADLVAPGSDLCERHTEARERQHRADETAGASWWETHCRSCGTAMPDGGICPQCAEVDRLNKRQPGAPLSPDELARIFPPPVAESGPAAAGEAIPQTPRAPTRRWLGDPSLGRPLADLLQEGFEAMHRHERERLARAEAGFCVWAYDDGSKCGAPTEDGYGYCAVHVQAHVQRGGTRTEVTLAHWRARLAAQERGLKRRAVTHDNPAAGGGKPRLKENQMSGEATNAVTVLAEWDALAAMARQIPEQVEADDAAGFGLPADSDAVEAADVILAVCARKHTEFDQMVEAAEGKEHAAAGRYQD